MYEQPELVHCTRSNQRGVTTLFGKRFNGTVVRCTVSNPAYAGMIVGGRKRRGKFRSVHDDGDAICENTQDPQPRPPARLDCQRIALLASGVGNEHASNRAAETGQEKLSMLVDGREPAEFHEILTRRLPAGSPDTYESKAQYCRRSEL